MAPPQQGPLELDAVVVEADAPASSLSKSPSVSKRSPFRVLPPLVRTKDEEP